MTRFNPHDDQAEQFPAELREALVRLHDPGIAVPPEVDEFILSGARRSFHHRRRRWLLVRRVGAAVAAAAVLVIAVKVFVPTRTAPSPVAFSQRPQLAQAADVNHDGRVDIVDAYIVARKIAHHEPLDPAWDINGDGVIDQKDVDLIANMAVQSSDTERPR